MLILTFWASIALRWRAARLFLDEANRSATCQQPLLSDQRKLQAYFVLISVFKIAAILQCMSISLDLRRHGGMATQSPAERLISVRLRVSAWSFRNYLSRMFLKWWCTNTAQRRCINALKASRCGKNEA